MAYRLDPLYLRAYTAEGRNACFIKDVIRDQVHF